MTFYTRKAALEAQNALHNIKTMPGVSIYSYIYTLFKKAVVICGSSSSGMHVKLCCSIRFVLILNSVSYP